MDVVNAVLAVFGKTLGIVDAPREPLSGDESADSFEVDG
jgi:hypothetical protein